MKSFTVLVPEYYLPLVSQVRVFTALQQSNAVYNKSFSGVPYYLFTKCGHCNTFIVAVGPIGKEVQELVHRGMRAVLQLGVRGNRK